uniref:non-specific serine/threonine protein kinase n=2 Tax=Ciona intestinalis TaxID=7719 RepID=F6RJ65_CIOIN
MKYRPQDISALVCRKAMMSVSGKTADVKLEKYKEVCSKFKPVFRHFFTEKFVEPQEWFNKRQSYTRSVAVSSIIGYVLGLGDRHVQNILINCNTAEIVHIDLGVAFEQGRCLPTPETVPFRLTRDIVDGMGLCGVEGVFRRCCERTMQVMRSSYDAITTIVEVLLYDPLHDWALSPTKARTLQRNVDATLDCSLSSTLSTYSTRADVQSDANNTNKLAERVLLRLQEKLQGTEEGSVLSVRGQVNMLIQQASDPMRLCQLFAGWQPYL